MAYLGHVNEVWYLEMVPNSFVGYEEKKAQVFLEMRLDPVAALVYQSSDQEVSVSLSRHLSLRCYWSWEDCEPLWRLFSPLLYSRY